MRRLIARQSTLFVKARRRRVDARLSERRRSLSIFNGPRPDLFQDHEALPLVPSGILHPCGQDGD